MGDPNSWREPMILSTSTSLEDICLPTSRTKWPRNTCDDCPIHMGIPRHLSADKRRRITGDLCWRFSGDICSWIFFILLGILGHLVSGRIDFWRLLEHIWVLGSFLGSSSSFLGFLSGRDNDFSGTGIWSMDLLVQRLNVNA